MKIPAPFRSVLYPTAVAVGMALFAGATVAQAPRNRRPGGFEPGERMNRPGPWDHDALIQRSSGQDSEQLGSFPRAGVPTVTRLTDGRLIAAYQCFPDDKPSDFDKVAVRFSSDEGRTWTGPSVIRLTGWPEEKRFPFDPTLVALPEGRVRLYFTAMRKQSPEAPTIGSAVSDNGIDFAMEPGTRFQVEGRPVIDCAVALHAGEFHLFAPDNGAGGPPGDPGQDQRPPDDRPRDGVGYHAISSDGLAFRRVEDVRLEGRRWLGNVQSEGNALVFHGTGPRGIWRASSVDGNRWSEPETLAGIRGADPGAVKLKDGSWLVIATGPPRPDASSAERWGRRGPGGPQGNREPGPRPFPPGPLLDVAYVPGGHERQTLDLYLPAPTDRPSPVIVWIHGGAWQSGSKEQPPALRFLALGFAVASINYRLSQHATFPAQLEDCKAAIRWLRAHAREHRLDPRRIGVWGSSAGGHLVALLGTTGDTREFDVGPNLDEDSRVSCVVDFFGPTDFLQMDAHRPANGMVHEVADSPESRLVGGLITKFPDRVARVNPVTYVTERDAPFLLVHGDEDGLVPHHQSELLAVALAKAGVPVQFYTVRGGGHGGFKDDNVHDLVTGFLLRHLGSRPER